MAAVEYEKCTSVVELMICLDESVRQEESFANRLFVCSVSPVSVSGSSESHHGIHPLHGSQLSQSDSVLRAP